MRAARMGQLGRRSGKALTWPAREERSLTILGGKAQLEGFEYHSSDDSVTYRSMATAIKDRKVPRAVVGGLSKIKLLVNLFGTSSCINSN